MGSLQFPIVFDESLFYFCTVQLLVAVSSDEFVEYETGVSTSFVEADIYVYEDARTDTGTGCTLGESNIGSCINLEDKNEQYLCDFVSREVYIASCKNTDCTDCEFPMPNEYGYQDDVCQSNGFLKAKCTDVCGNKRWRALMPRIYIDYKRCECTIVHFHFIK